MRVLVLGAYGLIGSAIAARLAEDGHEVVGLGRSVAFGKRVLPHIAWTGADLSTLVTAESWTPHLGGIDAVVNASGVLQDGARDRVRRTQSDAIRALVSACETQGVRRFVQISAPGATRDASTAFLSTKAEADDALRASALDWIVLKPGLVIAPAAYGGTSLLRMLAAFPLLQPLTHAESVVQTVAVSDVADAVSRALAGGAPMRADYDLVSSEALTLQAVVGQFRAWLGFAPARATIRAPAWLGAIIARLGDLAGWFGWRPPLRTTAMRVMAEGVRGDPAPWRAATGAPLATLSETLARIPSTLQERVFARTQLVFPVLVVLLAGFWIASGVIGFWRSDDAAAELADVMDAPAALVLVFGGAILDIAIGLGLLMRAWVRRAALAAIAVSLAYLAAGTMLTPELWADPLGPLVKIFPAIGLALAVAAMAEQR